jgi:ectoine hydroxylase-related dioxygenase (phytanoyl-CoA dioxygenase family)
MQLSRTQIARFEDEGYLVVEGVLRAADLEPLIADFDELVDEIARDLVGQGRIAESYAGLPFERRLAVLTWACGESLQHRVSFPANHRRAVFDFVNNERLLDLVEGLVGSEIHCHPTQHVRPKLPAFIGGGACRDFSYESPVHQDAAALLPEADGTLVVTTWIPLVDVSRDMGPVEVYPRWHRGGILRHVKAPGRGLTIAADVLPEGAAVPIPLEKGSVLLLHGRTPHRSQPNSTQIVRWSLDLRWNDASQPAGRPLPGLLVRSRNRPLTSYECWLREWREVQRNRVPHVLDRWRPS